MKRAVLPLIALAVTAAFACADQWRDVDIDKLIADAPGVDEYPNASAVFLNLQEQTTVAPDGAMTTERNRLIKILTLRGRERHSNQSFYYDTDHSTLGMVRGVTFRQSGRTVDVEADGINDITPAFLEGATIYANVLEKVISFPVAGPGSTIDLEVREETAPAKDGSFSGIEYLGAEDPIMAASFTLGYPETMEVLRNSAFTGQLGELEIDKTSQVGKIVVNINDVPALVEEENMPPTSELFPSFMYSSYTDWSEPAAFFAGEFFPHVQTDGDVAARVRDLTAGLQPDADKKRVIFIDVATGVRNIFLNLGLGGYEPNDAATVLANKYGDTRDKAVLLISMLRAAGIDAYPALVKSQRGSFVDAVPTLKQFSRILVAIPEGDGYGFLDPFLDDVAYGYLRWGRGNTALVVRDDGSGDLTEIPPFVPGENSSAREMTVVLSPGGSAAIDASCDLTGYFDRSARQALKDATPSEEKKAFDAAANAVSTGAVDVSHSHSDLTDLNVSVTVDQEIEAPDLAVPQGDMMIVRLPAFPFGFAATGVHPSLAERKYPFEVPCESQSSFRIEIKLPEGYNVAWKPEGTSLSTDWMDATLRCEWDPSVRTVVWEQDVTFKEMTVPVTGYTTFKAEYDALASPKNRLLLLRKA
jgi:hypothetical protein